MTSKLPSQEQSEKINKIIQFVEQLFEMNGPENKSVFLDEHLSGEKLVTIAYPIQGKSSEYQPGKERLPQGTPIVIFDGPEASRPPGGMIFEFRRVGVFQRGGPTFFLVDRTDDENLMLSGLRIYENFNSIDYRPSDPDVKH